MINEDVKEAIFRKLFEVFPNIATYKEATTNPEYPHFFIYQIDVIDTEERKRHHILTYSMTIRYRVASDVSTDLKLQNKLDEMSFNLLQNFNTLDFNDEKIRCYDKHTEKVDGVLHFFFNIDLLVYDEDNVKYNKFDKMKLNMEVAK